MSELKKAIKINRLLDIYGKVLTKQQYEIMSDYFKCDLSLSEISENRKISRTAVSDAIKNATIKLENLEKKIRLCEVLDKNKNSKTKFVIEKIEEDIKNGI